MKIKELEDYVIKNHIEWRIEGENIILNNPQYDEALKITPKGLQNLTVVELEKIYL